MLKSFSLERTIPLTKARERLGRLVKSLGEDDNEAYLLTRRGKPEAVLVDAERWEKLVGRLRQIYQQTYIAPDNKKYTRLFSNEEIKGWEQEDRI